MPWRLPVGLDALLPSCRACKAAALLVWHRHAGSHRRDPLRRSHAPSTSLHRVAVPCSTPSPRHAPTPALRCRSVSFCGASSLPFADVPLRRASASLHGGTSIPLHGAASALLHGSAPLRSSGIASIPLHGLSPLRSTGAPPFRSTGLPPLCSTGRLHFAPQVRRSPENSRFEASFSVSGRRASTKM